MIRLSVNVLTSIIVLLKRISSYHFSSVNELSQSRISQLDPEDIYLLACNCKWAETDVFGHPILTQQGNQIVTLGIDNLYCQYMRMLLADYITHIGPIWSNRIPYGRSEATIFMSKDERACFYEANLLDEKPDEAVVSWWDKVADQIRVKSDEKKTLIGRRGEYLTISYEMKRTSIFPKWVAIDSNLSGYDIKSQISKDDNTPIFIEVKTSGERMNDAFFHITEREWLTAQLSESYMFYLWCIYGGIKALAITKSESIKQYIPTNNQSGEWESVRIPFASFKDKFIVIEEGSL